MDLSRRRRWLGRPGPEASLLPKVSNSRYLGFQLADTQVYKHFVENESFRRFVGDMVYAITSEA